MDTRIVTLDDLSDELRKPVGAILEAYGRRVVMTTGRHVGCDTRRGVDVSCTSARDRYHLVTLAIANGVKRIGLYAAWVHLDIEPSLPHPALWVGLRTRGGEA